jgi:hypothetical protein
MTLIQRMMGHSDHALNRCWVKVWLGYQKRLSPFVSNGHPHLKHVVT